MTTMTMETTDQPTVAGRLLTGGRAAELADSPRHAPGDDRLHPETSAI
jgi:hypothetical protein